MAPERISDEGQEQQLQVVTRIRLSLLSGKQYIRKRKREREREIPGCSVFIVTGSPHKRGQSLLTPEIGDKPPGAPKQRGSSPITPDRIGVHQEQVRSRVFSISLSPHVLLIRMSSDKFWTGGKVDVFRLRSTDWTVFERFQMILPYKVPKLG